MLRFESILKMIGGAIFEVVNAKRGQGRTKEDKGGQGRTREDKRGSKEEKGGQQRTKDDKEGQWIKKQQFGTEKQLLASIHCS